MMTSQRWTRRKRARACPRVSVFASCLLSVAILLFPGAAAYAHVYDVTEPPYGAACDGAANDFAALDDAIRDAGRAGGGIVWIPQGVCRVLPIPGRSTFEVPDDVQIAGEGSGSIVEAGSGGHVVFSIADRSDVIVRDLSIREGDDDLGGLGSAISITGRSQRILLENVRTRGFAHGIYSEDHSVPLDDHVDELVLRDVWVERASDVGIVLGHVQNARLYNVRSTANANDGLKFLAGSRYWEIHGGRFWNNAGAGINLVSGGNKWLVIGSRADSNQTGGILVKTSSDHTTADSPVMEGTLVDVVADGNLNGSPGLDFNAQVAEGDPLPHHITVHGGVFARNEGAGIQLRAGRNISLIGVVAKENGAQGIAINQDSFDINVIGAQISANGQSGASAGILVLGDRVRIIGGTLNGRNDDVAVGDPVVASTHTTNIQVAASGADDVLIDGVVLRNATSGQIGNPRRAVVRNSVGHVTQKTGSATLRSGTDSVFVPHGLDVTPLPDQIAVTPLGDWGAARHFWVDYATRVGFAIRVDADPGRDLDFGWSIDASGH